VAGLPENIPRVIALIDLPDLTWQVEFLGGSVGPDLGAVVHRLEAGLEALEPELVDPDRPGSEPPSFDHVYVYASREADQECTICGKACTHCKGSVKSPGGRGHDNPIAIDLISLAREGAYDWAVIVTTDTWLGPIVKFIQSHGRKVIHGCFPPIAVDLTRQCWASIDLRP
jgi:hypothetical protein